MHHVLYRSSWLTQDEQSQKFAIDNMGFLINGYERRVIWIPAHLRGYTIVAHANNVVIGGRSGAMTLIRFNHDSWRGGIE